MLQKGGHTVAVQYAGASKAVTFTLKGWNLAVQAYPQPEEAPKRRPAKAARINAPGPRRDAGAVRPRVRL